MKLRYIKRTILREYCYDASASPLAGFPAGHSTPIRSVYAARWWLASNNRGWEAAFPEEPQPRYVLLIDT
jgi:hypothetical protein